MKPESLVAKLHKALTDLSFEVDFTVRNRDFPEAMMLKELTTTAHQICNDAGDYLRSRNYRWDGRAFVVGASRVEY